VVYIYSNQELYASDSNHGPGNQRQIPFNIQTSIIFPTLVNPKILLMIPFEFCRKFNTQTEKKHEGLSYFNST